MALDPLTAGLDLAKTLIDAIVSRIPDPQERERERARLEAAAQAASDARLQGQLEVQKAEATHPSLFVAGARPAVMWVCAFTLAAYYGVGSLVGIGLWAYACVASGQLQPRPDMGLADVFGLVLPMLGIGALRTTEKLRGVATQTCRRHPRRAGGQE